MAEVQRNDGSRPGLPKSQVIGLILGAAFLLATLVLPAPGSMGAEAWAALGLMLLMATWWSTEAIPIPATALLPIVLVPALELGTIGQATAPYANPIIFLFLGGFTLGLAMQRWNLHRRIALLTLKAMGDQPKRQIAGFMLATAFLSMWVSNTATAIMMLPIGLSVVAMMDNANPEGVRKYATALLLAIAYSASIGGIATLIGTPPNALLAAYLSENQGISVGFAQWMVLGVPVTLLMLMLTWWWLTRRDFGIGQASDSDQMIRDELAKLGVMSRGERLVAVVFVITATAWIFRPLLSASLMPWLSDTGIAIAAAIAMFLIPVDTRERTFVLDWDSANKLPWGVLLLFGGGLAMAGVISSSGLAEWIASSLGVAGALPTIVMMVIVATVIIFLTEVTSNTATAAAFLPLLGALAMAQDVSPLLLTVPAAIAASCAFMMPVATPPNAIVFSSGHMQISDMIKAGFVLNLMGIVVVTLITYGLLGLVFTL
ncbi:MULTISPECIES: SLC13 family permease [Marinobacter]|uniref:SLC13 family permease n=1 Tax=Marinobacter TaxID=2742 RepID=UPI0003B89893|nr:MULTISPECIES: DASS family sodium-coupled anion symporter [Marinobacter]ERS12434.1 anion transporter [Marinobacter sp. EN3]MBY5936281.1 DASS family sodium-coupled anion symporter [Marinobacter nauticus]MBY5953510.1 DASS family sodium-coupled anion symporter [Marinobacter nauticus]MBY6007303.1 DASS family sodium-coupled anion symporter [Marinobacter nauticus]MBY6193402.1 DASS family sodium-coupled anion symporter [Marinobacter nauticus]